MLHMVLSALNYIFKSRNTKIISKFSKIVAEINALEDSIQALDDADFPKRTEELRSKLSNSSPDDLLPEAFALVREACVRVLGLRHFDVQLVGGIALHKGMISEMKTGEGKTLVAALPAYLNALSSDGVHIVTVNDYLAKRDAELVGSVFKFLGLTVGCVHSEIEDSDRKAQYLADITYGTNNEFAFDYLRDNLKYSLDEMSQRGYNYAIVDEVDSILIDEARTPLIISGASETNIEVYYLVDSIVKTLEPSNYEVDEKNKQVTLTDLGYSNVERILKQRGTIVSDSTLYDVENMELLHSITQSLRARLLFSNNKEYMVKGGEVMIVDEFTGRIMEGRRYSDGLHQALEAKEGVKIQNENQTIASVTFQNYFRMYKKLAGMTGTAKTEEAEFTDIYNLEVLCVPTHMPIERIDENDEIYMTDEEKMAAMISEIRKAHEYGQPVLIGTTSIHNSERVSKLLSNYKIKHKVLNAKHHDKEAAIIAQAGCPYAVTIATNMAGRGTDIKLGGSPEMRVMDEIENKRQKDQQEISVEEIDKIVENVKAQCARDKEFILQRGGLLVIGTERHESRRIDDQLRGRSGRQGDPGRTKFYLSLDDELLKLFVSEKAGAMLAKLAPQKGEPIIHPWITKSIEKAQGKVEMRNYEMRKMLLKFDDVANKQRRVIFDYRMRILQSENMVEEIKQMAHELNDKVIDLYLPEGALIEEWDLDLFKKHYHAVYGFSLSDAEITVLDDKLARADYFNHLTDEYFDKMCNDVPTLPKIFSTIGLMSLDFAWKDYLHILDHLKSGIHLRSYGQKDPLNEYKIEAYKAFNQMLDDARETVITRCAHIKDAASEHNMNRIIEEKRKAVVHNKAVNTNDPTGLKKIGRNSPCPCGSGIKYKHCHGSVTG